MSDPDPASSDTHADADADTIETTTAGLSPRWWRNRRRGFYLIVTAATVALLWGGWAWWAWWYRADFPMLQLGWLQKLGADSEWQYETQSKLYVWKTRRELKSLRLDGTVWSDPESRSNGTLTFGHDGRIHLDPPTALLLMSGYTAWTSTLTDLDSIGAVLLSLDGAEFRMLPSFPPKGSPDMRFHSDGKPFLYGILPNVEVHASPCKFEGFYDGKTLKMTFRTGDDGKGTSLFYFFSRVQ